MDISVVILSFNSEKHIGKCLGALHQTVQRAALKTEVFVVENGSTDDSLGCIQMFREHFGDSLKIINLRENTGTTYSRNQALKLARGKFVLVLDSDAYVNELAINKLSYRE